jgi:hypothetical protein
MTKEQSELFDFSMDLGFTRETREGIERAARNANEVWTNYAKHAFVFMAVGRMFFTSADVDVYMMEHFPQIKTHENHGWLECECGCMNNVDAKPSTPAPASAEPPQIGWVIEDDEYGRLCLGMECSKLAWVTFTNENALRFARRIDAENAKTIWKVNGNVRDHSWG